MFVGKNFLPVDDQSQFEVNVRAPEGFTLPATSTLAERIAADLRKLPGVTDTLTTIGGGQQEQVNVASIYVKLTPIEERNISQENVDGAGAHGSAGKVSKTLSGTVAHERAAGGGDLGRRIPQR